MNIQYCIDKCIESPYIKNQSRHYAIVLDKRGKVVGEGRNDYNKTHTLPFKVGKKMGLSERVCLHAEQQALIRDRHRKGVKLIVVRVGAKNTPLYSAPCKLCAAIIKQHFPNIKTIEFSV